MKTDRHKDGADKDARPQKVLLHIARQNGNWAGRAISFGRKEEILFSSFEEFVEWLSNNPNQEQGRSK
jgi:hypothetical protein